MNVQRIAAAMNVQGIEAAVNSHASDQRPRKELLLQ